jgi:hypothetical protein
LTGLFPPLPDQTRRFLHSLPGLIDKVFPLPGRFRAAVPDGVATLSRLLTSERAERGASYLGKSALLSAYLRYFFPWNIYRLSRLFSSLPLDLNPHDSVNDLGAGPLTLAASLWISRPELRNIPLEFRCLDRTAAVLEAGKKFFTALTAVCPPESGACCPWTVKTIRGELRRSGSLSVEIRGKPAALSAAVNIYNELFWDLSPLDVDALKRFAEKQARLLSSLTEISGSILVVEPGIPRSGEFISLLRSALIVEDRFPLSPCTHRSPCPLPGSRTKNNVKTKWCHFAIDTEDAPQELHKLSAASGLPKERAVLSFILAGRPETPEQNQVKRKPPTAISDKPVNIRVISDPFPVIAEKTPVGNSWGRYGCSEHGLVLVAGDKKSLSPSGAVEKLSLSTGLRDGKSGAFMAMKKPKYKI